uniref:Candidate secreted effector n=1 Tax=Meloidogyne incognita TaxID=6306 RepID=A0A914NET5_MELIC
MSVQINISSFIFLLVFKIKQFNNVRNKIWKLLINLKNQRFWKWLRWVLDAVIDSLNFTSHNSNFII